MVKLPKFSFKSKGGYEKFTDLSKVGSGSSKRVTNQIPSYYTKKAASKKVSNKIPSYYSKKASASKSIFNKVKSKVTSRFTKKPITKQASVKQSTPDIMNMSNATIQSNYDKGIRQKAMGSLKTLAKKQGTNSASSVIKNKFAGVKTNVDPTMMYFASQAVNDKLQAVEEAKQARAQAAQDNAVARRAQFFG